MIDNKIRKQIKKEWLKAFPGLSAYAPNRLYKIIGAFVCGIELIRLPYVDDYRPCLVAYSLYGKDIKCCFQYPVLMFEFYDEKGFQFDLPYNDIREEYKKVQDIISETLKISFNGDVPLYGFYELINDGIVNNISYRSNSGRRASLFELKYYAALYVGDETEMEKIIDQILTDSKGWNFPSFEDMYGAFDIWIKGLQATDRNKFLVQVGINKQDKKIAKLQRSEIVLVAYLE